MKTKYLVTQDSFSIKLMLGFLKSCLFLDSACLKEISEPLQRIIYLGIMNMSVVLLSSITNMIPLESSVQYSVNVCLSHL